MNRDYWRWRTMRWWNIRSMLWCVVAALPLVALVACGHAAQGGGNSVATSGPTQGVVVEVGATSYATTSAIVVTVRNRLGSDIVATDHQTSCTIVQLQIEADGSWQNQGGCALGIATRQIPLKAGSDTAVTLTPGAGQISAKPWPAGSYRVAFTYRIGVIATPSASETVYSAPFTIG